MTGLHSLFLVRCDREEKQTWGNRFQSISKISPDWRDIGHLFMLFLTEGSSEFETATLL